MRPSFSESSRPLLEVEQLKVEFKTPDGSLIAVDGASFSVAQGEVLAMVGESGSGKSVTALAIMGLLGSTMGCRLSGAIRYAGQSLLELDDEALRSIRGSQVGMIFQEPMTSLNPLLRIGTQISESLVTHLDLPWKQANERAAELLDMVGIAESRRRMRDYPHQFSGGMRQRVMIAMALACEPRLLIADEPTTALDVTIQAQILELIKTLTQTLNLAVILITHNLGIVARYANTIGVMYAGRLVESASTEQLFANPAHPYTRGLIDSVPRLDWHRNRPLPTIEGQPPDPRRRTQGCRFANRCTQVMEECRKIQPPWHRVREGHYSACWFS